MHEGVRPIGLAHFPLCFQTIRDRLADMASVKFYKKLSPKVKFYLSSGHFLQFDIIDSDIAVAAITDENQQKDIATATRENRGGIEEITAEEYQALQGKKKEDLPKIWREEFSPQRSMGQTAVLPQDDPVAAGPASGRAERISAVAVNAKPQARKK